MTAAHDPRRRSAPTPPRRRSCSTSTGPWRRSSSDPEAAAVPHAGRRACSRELASRYGLVACVSGRHALDARRIVGLDQLTYAGNHGLELLAARRRRASPRPARRRRRGRRPRAFASRLDWSGPRRRPASGSRTRGRSRRSTGAAPRIPTLAESRAARDRRDGAEAAGLGARRGRLVLELRPRSPSTRASRCAG